ncbi:MAG: type VI secretion system tip protein VgrG [Polyangiaceae bacterium]|nr:type VI secretion system tip protein VgrG [Polyangiaceae bacterium]
MSQDDFVFAWEGGWGTWQELRVVRFEGEEAMSRLFRYEIHLLAAKGEDEPSPDELVGQRASLRIATLSDPPYKLVHGVITEASDAGEAPEGTILRITLEPPLVRARYRRRCRIFLDKTLRQIVEAVLRTDSQMTLKSGAMLDAPQGSPAYKPAQEAFTWRLSKGARIDDLKARPYVVQYNESDLDFVARLLEEEGISYHVENSDDTSLLVLSDADAGRPRVADNDTLGPGLAGRDISRFRMGGRLRAKSIKLGEHNWVKPAVDVGAGASDGDSDLAEYAFPGGYLDSSELGAPIAQAMLDQLHTEASFATGAGTARVLSAGSIFSLEHPKARYEGEYLVTVLRVRGYQEGVVSVVSGSGSKEPFVAELEGAQRGRGKQIAESRFRPARRTPKPRIFGTQTAIVTAEPGAKGAEVNLGGPSSIGCVRVKFHWDIEDARLAKEPSSMWVRVSQPFARGGQGGVWHPRVGVEVIVEFEEGDPDRPIITGRVYNGKNRPSRTAPTHSTFHSLATPGGGVRNEISFEDTAGSERIYLNAGKDMVTNVGNNRVENVGANALMTVGADNLETIGSNQTVNVGANDTLAVGANQTEEIGSNQLRIVGGNRSIEVGGNETRKTGANHANIVGGSLKEKVGGDETEEYGAFRNTSIAANYTEDYGATRDQTVGAVALQLYGGNHITEVGGSRTINGGAMLGVLIGGNQTNTIGGSDTVNVGAASIHVAGGVIEYTGASLDINATLKIHLIGHKHSRFWAKATATGYSSSKTGLSVSVKGMSIDFIGVKRSKTIFNKEAAGALNENDAAKLNLVGILIHPAGIHTMT